VVVTTVISIIYVLNLLESFPTAITSMYHGTAFVLPEQVHARRCMKYKYTKTGNSIIDR